MTTFIEPTVSHDNWLLDPNLAEKIKHPDPDVNSPIAVSLRCQFPEFWMPNPWELDLPRTIMLQCWESASLAYGERRRDLFEITYKNKRKALSSVLTSYTPHQMREVVIFGKPLSTYSDLPSYKPDDEYWIGVNHALLDPEGLDLCWNNALQGFRVKKRQGDYPMLISSLTSDPRINQTWPSEIVYYVAPSARGLTIAESLAIGELWDPGDPTIALCYWAVSQGAQVIKFHDADVTRSVSTSGAYEVAAGRWVYEGQGMNLACWKSLHWFGAKAGAELIVKSGWDPKVKSANQP